MTTDCNQAFETAEARHGSVERMVGHVQMFFGLRQDWETCDHSCFYTTAYVPGGSYCPRCDTLLDQSVPVPPESIGYLTADWAWHLEGKPWTTQILPNSVIGETSGEGLERK